MIYSMTGYGKGEAAAEGITLCVELRSVNHRYGEVACRLPRFLLGLEPALKKRISERLRRGRIDLSVSADFTGSSVAVRPVLNRPLAEAYLRTFQELKEGLGLAGEIPLELLAGQKDVIAVREEQLSEELLQDCLGRALDGALEGILAMRRAEGEAIERDLAERVERLGALLERIRSRAEEVPEIWRRKLSERLARLAPERDVDPQRIAQELILFADRSDISEEVVRFASHLEQFRGLFANGEPVGRQMDFLIQEMNREANTMGSKANEASLAQEVVALKTELEKIREQVQNVE